MNVCPNCQRPIDNAQEHECVIRQYYDSEPGDSAPHWQQPDGYVYNARVQSDVELSDDMLDMRFHVEKQQDPNVGKVINDRYKIVSVVGRGGMGVVYRAEHLSLDRPIAIKMLHPHIVADAETIKRFQQEARAVSKVEHPHTVLIYDFGITDQAQPFLVMDFVDGDSLRGVLRRHTALDMKRTEDIYLQVIEALDCAHQAGIIHRDMKPENIMLCEKGERTDFVYVVDFGISTLATTEYDRHGAAQSTETRGSPAYMSPEQCIKGAPVDHRSDIYSLAVSVYETLTGKLPYSARNAFELIDAHINQQPVPFAASSQQFSACERLSTVLLKAMHKQPDQRYQTAAEFGADLAEAFRRDSIRLNYLIHRKDALLSQASQDEVPTLQHEPVQIVHSDMTVSQSKIKIFDDGQITTGVNLVKSVIGSITGSHPVQQEDEAAPAKIVYSNCPRCNTPVESGIAFCLACGRSLATTHEFAKIRAASGVFTLPMQHQHDSVATGTPVFRMKGRSGGLLDQLNRWLLLPIILLAAIILFWFLGGKGIILQMLTQFSPK